jgi:(1->4)-alpha-D-glucan 1-alpha-D-glucosylmutase
LISLNEVGGNLSKFGSEPDELHAFFQSRATSYAGGLSTLSTHDTKRSEDVRARINVLSEIPVEWGRRIELWRRLNLRFKVELDEGIVAPDDNEEYFLYQTLIGVWHAGNGSLSADKEFVSRVQQYMIKALREAKVHSSWIYPETKYDDGVTSFIASILNPQLSTAFLADFQKLHEFIEPIGRLNSLSQTLLRCTAPGVPDIYQGCDSWDFSLVDPDNRRPVDYQSRTQMLDRIDNRDTSAGETQARRLRGIVESEQSKLFVTAKTLRWRRQHTELFQSANYIPLQVQGADAQHVFAFMWHRDDESLIVAVPRLIVGLHNDGKWIADDCQLNIDANLLLPEQCGQSRWKNLFSGIECRSESQSIPARELFDCFPVCVLSKIQERTATVKM